MAYDTAAICFVILEIIAVSVLFTCETNKSQESQTAFLILLSKKAL